MPQRVPSAAKSWFPRLLVVASLSWLWRQAQHESFIAGNRPWRETPRKLPATAIFAVARPSPKGPSDFDRALLSELEAFKDLDITFPSDVSRWRHVEAREALRAEALLGFEHMQVPLFANKSGEGLSHPQLKRLATELYSKDAVALIQQYVMSLIEPWDHLVRDHSLTLARFQLAQVYWTSCLFGLSLRQAEVRFALEKAADREVDSSLSDYVTKLGGEEVLLSSVSLETRQAIEDQVAQLYGDPHDLWRRLHSVLGPVSGSEEDLHRLRQAMKDGQVEVSPVTVSQLRHLALEGIAFGFLLSKAEAQRTELTTMKVPPGGPYSEVFGRFHWSFGGDRSQWI